MIIRKKKYIILENFLLKRKHTKTSKRNKVTLKVLKLSNYNKVYFHGDNILTPVTGAGNFLNVRQ